MVRYRSGLQKPSSTQGVGEKFLANINVEIGVDEDDTPIHSFAIIDKSDK